MNINKYFSIAIDGPAGSGKSTIAKIFAEKCKDFTYINTGSMFRAIAYFCLKNNIDINNEENLKEKINLINIELEESMVFIIKGDEREEISNLIRTPEIDKLASQVSKIKIVRDKLLNDQVLLSQKSNVIMDGRDIGTVVLPNASLKIFLTANIDVRAKRRFEQIKKENADISLEQIKGEIIKRDEEDIQREISPLIQSKDAVLIDSSEYSINEILFIIQKEYLKRNKKNLLTELNKINKTTNTLMLDFIDIYNDVFIKKDLISYDEIIELDYKIYDVHNLLVNYLENLLFLKEQISTNALALYNDVFNEIKMPIDDFIKSDKFDLLYYSHLLVKIYILIPYIYNAIGKYIFKQKSNVTKERFNYLVKTRFLSKYIYSNCSLFKKLDDLDLKISNLIEETNEKHSQLQHSYYLTHKKFNQLFNKFILIEDFEIKEANFVFKLSLLFKYWYYLLASLIFIIIILLVIIILATK